jgi:hypothetical protein
LCQNLRTGTGTAGVFCGGRFWNIGSCGGSIELSADGDTCSCSSGYIARPCIGNQSWGGVNGPTCGAGTQTITVVCR